METPGSQSSEFSLSKLVSIVGAVVAGVGVVLEVLADMGLGAHWVGVALALVGAAMKVLTVLGYQNQRTQLKVAALNAGAAANAAASAQVKNLDDAQAVLNASLKGE